MTEAPMTTPPSSLAVMTLARQIGAIVVEIVRALARLLLLIAQLVLASLKLAVGSAWGKAHYG